MRLEPDVSKSFSPLSDRDTENENGLLLYWNLSMLVELLLPLPPSGASRTDFGT